MPPVIDFGSRGVMDISFTTDGSTARQIDLALDDGDLHADHGRLAAERGALRRLATLVASGGEPWEIFTAVADEMRRLVPATNAGLWRYEVAGEITLLAGSADPVAIAKWPVGARTRIDGHSLAAQVQRTGGPARIDSYEHLAGSIAGRVREAGVRAAVGVPVIVDGRLWGLAAVGAQRPGPLPADTEDRISGFAELVAGVVVAGYRDDQMRQMLDAESRRPLVIDSLLEGRIVDRWHLWEIAGCLRLPRTGPFVVIAADVPATGDQALPDIEPKLRSFDVHSVWRLLPDLQIGLAHVKSDHHLDRVLALLSRMATERVGVSSRFDDLRDAPQALHFAKVTLCGGRESGSRVAMFDGSVLATAAVSAPGAMLKLAEEALRGFDDLPQREREVLFETFRAWQENDASVRATADLLFCHPNTVRYRLHRIEQCTGRSLSRPRDIAELCLVMEVHRQLA